MRYMISEEKLHSKYCAEIESPEFALLGEYERGFSDGLKASMALSEPTYGEWIDRNDRLPEQFQRVLIRRRRGYGQLYWDNIGIDLGHEVIQNRHGDITHWMPLPEPPKEVRDDGTVSQ